MHVHAALGQVLASLEASRASITRLTVSDGAHPLAWHDLRPEHLAFALGRLADSLTELSVIRTDYLLTPGVLSLIGASQRLRRLTVDASDVILDAAFCGRLGRLEALSLGAGRFWGLEALGGLAGTLTTLRLGRGSCGGWCDIAAIPPAVAALRGLTSLSLEGCSIRELPEWCARCGRMRTELDANSSPPRLQ